MGGEIPRTGRSTTLALAALCAVSLLAGARQLRAASEVPEILAGGVGGVECARTSMPVTAKSLMDEGRFARLFYLYDVSFSPDGKWLAFIVDALSRDRKQQQYYVYILEPGSGRRELTVETTASSDLACSFAWAAGDTPVVANPDYVADVERPGTVDGAPWSRPLKIRGVDPRPRPGSGDLAFRRWEGEKQASLWLLSSDPGAQPTQLSPHAAVFGDLAWSPDGTELAFTSPQDADEGEALWTVKPGEAPQLLCGAPTVAFRWSPDSKSIAAQLESGELLVLRNSDAAELVSVPTARACVWSPDSNAVVCASADDTTGVERLLWADTSVGLVRPLLKSRSAGGWDYGVPELSADGRLVFVSGAAGSDVTGDGQVYDKADRSLFRVDIAADEVAVVPAAGAVPRMVTDPSGRYAVYVVESAETTTAWLLDLASGEVRDLGRAPIERYAYQLAWSSDARWLAVEDDLNLGLLELRARPAGGG